jgi:type IV pilus assembly protein PilC
VFNPLYVAMVRSGETGGMLEDSLLRTADQLEKEDALRRQVRSAMVYPTVVISFALIILLALVAFIVPVFAKVFKDFGGQLPSLTKVTVGISHFVTGRWYLMILGTALAVWSFLKWKKSKRGRPQWDRFRLRIPMRIGEVVQKVALARWSRTLSALVHAGVPILQAIDITGRSSRSPWPTCRTRSSAAGPSPAPSRRSRCFPRWSSTWSAWARRPAPWTRC